MHLYCHSNKYLQKYYDSETMKDDVTDKTIVKS